MTQVTGKNHLLWLWLTIFLALPALAQPDQWSASHPSATPGAADGRVAKPAETLYLQLRNVGLDPSQTFHIRGASIDRAALHLTFDDGEISFTTSVDGHITGAFFDGDGEVLLTPPNQVERASMTLFTGMAILEERFSTGYLRFNDQTFEELKPYLRPDDDAKAFSARWDQTARNLSESDALRLLTTFSRLLPEEKSSQQNADSPVEAGPVDRMLHARLQGEKLGTFDVYFDTTALEEVWAGQGKNLEGTSYYDLWTSFGLADRKSANAGNKPRERTDGVEVSNYRIRAEVLPPTTLKAEASLQVSVRRGGARTLFFELSRFLQVKQVEVNGRAVEFINNTAIDGTQLARRGNDLVAVVFPGVLRAGQTIEMRFVYGGDVLSEAGGGLLYVGARGIWYPNRGVHSSNFDLEFHYPPSWTLVATGKRVAETTNSLRDKDTPETSGSHGEQVAHWITERPSGLAGFNLGKYEHATAQVDSVIVDTYAARGVERNFPRGSEALVARSDIGTPYSSPERLSRPSADPSPARNAQEVANEGARAVSFFSARFGPFPYSSLNLTQMPGDLSQGWPGLVFLSSFSFLTPQEEFALHLNTTQEIFNRLVLPHEIAHQWWGDLVGWKTYRDQWIVEALANYSALMKLQEEHPLDFRKAMDQYRTDLLGKNKEDGLLRDAGPVTLGQRLNSSHFPNGYEAISYGRGTWLLHMLRSILLDAEEQERRAKPGTVERTEPFIRVLLKIRDRYAGKEISTQELFAMFEEDLPRPLWYEGKKSLDWFVNGWVEGVSLPHISIQNIKYVPKGAGMSVSATLVQKDAPADLVTAVPLYAVVMGKPTLVGIVFADGPETVFHLTVPSGTKKLVLDPNQTVLTSPK